MSLDKRVSEPMGEAAIKLVELTKTVITAGCVKELAERVLPSLAAVAAARSASLCVANSG